MTPELKMLARALGHARMTPRGWYMPAVAPHMEEAETISVLHLEGGAIVCPDGRDYSDHYAGDLDLLDAIDPDIEDPGLAGQLLDELADKHNVSAGRDANGWFCELDGGEVFEGATLGEAVTRAWLAVLGGGR